MAVLHEAGGIVWRDGTIAGYLRDASPLAPEANFLRDVDFCSRAFLLVADDSAADSSKASTTLSRRPATTTSISACASRRQVPRGVRSGRRGLPLVMAARPPMRRRSRSRARRCSAASTRPGCGIAPSPTRRRRCSRVQPVRRAARAVHRGHDAVAPARLRLRAIERPDPGDGRDWAIGVTVYPMAPAGSIWPRSTPTCLIRSR